MKKDNPDKLATQVHKTQDKINVREYGRVNDKRKSKETGNIGYTRNKTHKCQRIPKGKCKRTIQLTGNIAYTRDKTNKCQRIPKG